MLSLHRQINCISISERHYRRYWQEKLGGKRINQRLPLRTGRVKPEITRILIAKNQVTKLMGSGRPASPWIGIAADHSDGHIAVNHGCSLALDVGHEKQLASTFTDCCHATNRLISQIQPIS